MAGGRRRGFFSAESIERVRNASDITAVIGGHVALKRSGRSMKGLCPFHKEKTPSFFVSSERQSYHCFGCGAGGDVFSFLMEYLGMSFVDAVEELAQDAGIELEVSGRADTSRSDALLDLMSASEAFYREKLSSPDGSSARDYLLSRDLRKETIGDLSLGWAPSGTSLTEHLRGRGFSDTQMVESGISLRANDDPERLFDRFRARVMFPIHDRRGRVISFGGRLLPGDDSGKAPKYLNGPESPLYSKGEHLYGYREAAAAARDLDMIILVEGYFDHARFWQAGFHCVTATCGTALTQTQARQLGAVPAEILICYDGDAAGRRAAVAASEVILEQGSLPGIITVPDGMDPDDLIRREGPDAVLGMVSGARDPVRFALGLLGGWEEVSGSGRKVRVVNRLVSLASSARDPVTRETLLRTISDETGYTLKTLIEQLDSRDRKDRRGGRPSPGEGSLPRWDRTILRTILSSPDGLSDPLLDHLQSDDMRSEQGAGLLERFRRQREEGFSLLQLSDLDQDQVRLCAGLQADLPEYDPDGSESVIKAVERDRLEREKTELRNRLSEADPEERIRIQRRISEIGRLLGTMGRR